MKLFRTSYVYTNQGYDNIIVSFYHFGIRVELANFSAGRDAACEWGTAIARELELIFRQNPSDFVKYLRNTKQCAECPDTEKNAVIDALERGLAE